MRRALFVLIVAALVLPACGNTDRPEGVVERWLISLNQGRAGEPGMYAFDELSQHVLPDWQKRDPGDLDVIEVGRGEPAEGPFYLVPFRVQRLDGHELNATAEVVSLIRGPWRVGRLLPPEAGLRVPSKGGTRIGGASAAVWLAALGIALAFVLLSVVLMSTVGRKATVS